ncbi:MAG TPA: tetratricopeptide repeat protein [Polyangiaceae bacterium]|jgi:tetratricopeptide (TPR) repeat protein
MRRALSIALVLALAPTAALAAGQHKPSDAPAGLGESAEVKASTESQLTYTARERPHTNVTKAESEHPGTPAIRGPKLPEAVRARLKAQLDARIDRDVGQIRELRGEAIKLLETFIKEAPRESAEMPEAMMRLGELYWENEREGVVERFKEWEKKPVDQRGPAPEINYSLSRNLFAKVLKDYPWFSQYDLALYVDGFLATEQNKSEEAFARFTRILTEFPNSRFVPDAHMARAEIYFAKPDYQTALAEYEEVLKYQDHPDLVGLALFKSAWCYWRLGNNDEATRRFVEVFKATDTTNRHMNASQEKSLGELQEEALKYLVEVFTEDDKNTAQDMYNFLTRIRGDKFAGRIVRALATTYFDQAHYERGIEAYELLIKLEPTAREAGDWILQIAQGYSWLEDYPHLKTTYDRALANYTAGGSWARTQADPANVQKTTDKIEAQLREHALFLNAKAQKDKTSTAEFAGAADLYAAYLSKFSKAPKAFQIEYYLAEVDFRRLGRNTDAATHYMNAAREMPDELDKSAPGDPLKRHDAIYNAIASLERVRVAELEARKGKGGTLETETDKKFTEALTLYSQLYPNDPALPDLFFRQGKLYYDYQVYDSAVKLWGTMLEKWPQDSHAQMAGELIIDSFVKGKNYENIETWARKLKTYRAFADSKHQQKLEELIIQAMFKQGEQKAQANDHAGATAAYLRAAKEYPRDPRAAQAAVSAETEAKLSGDVTSLKEAATLITGKDYRDKPESPMGAWVAATTLQAMGLFDDAAEYDEAITANAEAHVPVYARYEHGKDAAFNAVILRAASADHDKAIADGNKFLALYGNSAEADEVVFQMGRAHQEAGRDKDAAELYKRYLARGTRNRDHRVQGYVLLAKAQLKENDTRGAEESLTTATRLGKQMKSQLGPDGKFAAAQARYMQGERVLAKFDQIKIEGDVKQLGKRLKQKADLLKQAATVFLDVVSFGVAEWTTAALYQTGHTFENFGKALREAPPPPEAKTEQEKEDAQGQIESFAVQFEERALDAYENGWKKAIELGIFNQWTAKMRDALGRLNAELYPPFKEIGFDVRSEGPSPLPALMDAPRRGVAAQAPTAAPVVTVVQPKETKKPKKK